MADFSFITHEDFRLALGADQAELIRCLEGRAWKAVHVLAGSITEAVLLDYLIATEYQKRPAEDLLKLTLHEAIAACRAEGVLSDRTAQLSVVIKDYRNLIHPGRAVRLQDKVDEQSARVAHALVEMVVAEVAKRKAEKYGNTAETLAAKVAADPSAVGILDHLLEGMKEQEVERLLLKVVPERHFSLLNQEHPPEKSLAALRQCYRRAFRKAGWETKKKALENLVRILKEEGEAVVLAHVDAFCQADDLLHAGYQERKIVKDHLVSRLERGVTEPLLEAVEGIGHYLDTEDVVPFIWSLASAYALGKDERLGQKAKDRVWKERINMNSYLAQESAKAIDEIIARYQEKGYGEEAVGRAREIKAMLDTPNPTT
jgi:hypothetical protein